MKTHDLKPLEAVKDFYGLNEQLTGDKLSANLSNIVMSFWHDLTSPFVADPDSFDIHSHGIDGPYRCIKMTPGADVIERVYDRVDGRAADLCKALNKAFNSNAFDLKIRREGGELDLMVAFTGAEGGIFTCNSIVQGGSFAVALRIPNDEEMKITFDSMAQVPTPSNVDQGPEGPELEADPVDSLDDIPETDPEMDDGIPMEGAYKRMATDEAEMERLAVALYKSAPADVKNQLPKAVAAFMRDSVPKYAKDKGFDPEEFAAAMRDIIQDKGEISEEMEDNKPKGAKIDRPDFQDEPFEPAEGELNVQDVDQENQYPIDEHDDQDPGDDLAKRLGTIEGALNILITKVDDVKLKDEIERLIGIAQLPRPDLLKMGESLRLIMRALPLVQTEEMPDMEPGDAPIIDYEDYEDAQQFSTEVQGEDVAGMSVSNMGGNVPGHDAGPGPVVKRKKKLKQESTSYRYVSLEKLNPFQR